VRNPFGFSLIARGAWLIRATRATPEMEIEISAGGDEDEDEEDDRLKANRERL
jgi:hypothetical protein